MADWLFEAENVIKKQKDIEEGNIVKVLYFSFLCCSISDDMIRYHYKYFSIIHGYSTNFSLVF